MLKYVLPIKSSTISNLANYSPSGQLAINSKVMEGVVNGATGKPKLESRLLEYTSS